MYRRITIIIDIGMEIHQIERNKVRDMRYNFENLKGDISIGFEIHLIYKHEQKLSR